MDVTTEVSWTGKVGRQQMVDGLLMADCDGWLGDGWLGEWVNG